MQYTFDVDPSWGASITHIVATARGGSVDDTYGWGVGSFYHNESPINLSFDTAGFPDLNLSQPTYRESLFYGIVQDLPNDAPGQKHLVLFMDPTAAANIAGLPYGTVFAGDPNAPTEEQLIAAIELLGSDFDAASPVLDAFADGISQHARVGPGGTEGSIWFEDAFSIVAFSDAKTLGGGTVDVTVDAVPEPATLSLMALGLAAYARRRRRTG